MQLHIISNGNFSEMPNDDIGLEITLSVLASDIISGRLILDFESKLVKEKLVDKF